MLSEELTKEDWDANCSHCQKHTHTEFLFSSLSYRSRTLRRVFCSLQSVPITAEPARCQAPPSQGEYQIMVSGPPESEQNVKQDKNRRAYIYNHLTKWLKWVVGTHVFGLISRTCHESILNSFRGTSVLWVSCLVEITTSRRNNNHNHGWGWWWQNLGEILCQVSFPTNSTCCVKLSKNLTGPPKLTPVGE